MTPPLVEVEWIDSLFAENEWAPIRAYRTSSLTGTRQRTAGYLIHKDRDRYIVAGSVNDCGHVCAGVIYIPRKAVVAMRTLHEKSRSPRTSLPADLPRADNGGDDAEADDLRTFSLRSDGTACDTFTTLNVFAPGPLARRAAAARDAADLAALKRTYGPGEPEA